MVLNMLSTGVMIKTGKVYSNLMVNVQPTNEKLVDRAARIIQTLTETDYDTALEALTTCQNNVKLEIASMPDENSVVNLLVPGGRVTLLPFTMDIIRPLWISGM